MDVQGPDGKVHSFPEGTQPDAIKAQMRQLYGGPQGGAQAPQPQAQQPQSGLLAPPPQGKKSLIDILPQLHAVMPDYAKGIVESPEYKQAQKAAEIQQRVSIAKTFGIDPMTPMGQQYVLTGHLPKMEPDRVAINKVDDHRVENANAIDNVQSARELNKKSMEYGPLTGAAAKVGGWFGNESALATQEYEAKAKLLSQQIAKENSGGRVNAFEQQLMAALQGGVGQPISVRENILADAEKHLLNRRKMLDSKSHELRTGTYYQPRDGAEAAAPTPKSAQAPRDLSKISTEELMRALTGGK